MRKILLVINTDGKRRKGLTYNRMPSGKFGENAAGVGRSADCNHYSQDLTRQWDFWSVYMQSWTDFLLRETVMKLNKQINKYLLNVSRIWPKDI